MERNCMQPVATQPDLVIAENDRSLLHHIATSFGISAKECGTLVEQAYRSHKENFVIQQDGTPTVQLIKCLVQKCVFLISCKLFSQYPAAANLLPAMNRYLKADKAPVIPLSYQIVFVLINTIRLKESEVAQILNVSTTEVRKRMARAQKLLNPV